MYHHGTDEIECENNALFNLFINSNLTGWWLPMLTKLITLIYLDS